MSPPPYREVDAVFRHGPALVPAVAGQNLTRSIQHFDSDLSGSGVCVETKFTLQVHQKPRGDDPGAGPGIQGDEPIFAQGGQADGAVALLDAMGCLEGAVVDPQLPADLQGMVEGLELAAVPRPRGTRSQHWNPIALLAFPGDSVPAAHQLTEDGTVVSAVHDPKDPEETEILALVRKGCEAVEVGMLSAPGHPAVIELVRNQDQLRRGPVLKPGRGADAHRAAPVSPHRRE